MLCKINNRHFNSFMTSKRLRGATVARLTPDQKVACSNHVGVKSHFYVSLLNTLFKISLLTTFDIKKNYFVFKSSQLLFVFLRLGLILKHKIINVTVK